VKVFLVAGARPNFMKIAPIYRASLSVSGVDCRIYIFTGLISLLAIYICSGII